MPIVSVAAPVRWKSQRTSWNGFVSINVNAIGSIRQHQQHKRQSNLEFTAPSDGLPQAVYQMLKLTQNETKETRYFRSINSNYVILTVSWLNWVTENTENSFK